MSDTSSVTSFGDISVCEEISQLIDQCHLLHEHIYNADITLENIKSLVKNNNNIQVTYNALDVSALKNIEETSVNNFSEKLLEALNNMTFN